MATRSIVTSQPDVACEVCERRLLRGEQPDVFIAAGRRRLVCELCAPRAAHEGWQRERDTQAVSVAPLRPRRGRTIIERLRHIGRPAAAADLEPGEGELQAPADEYALLDRPYGEDARAAAPGPEHAALRPHREHEEREEWAALDLDAGHAPPAGVRRELDPALERAMSLFNASAFPRRVAGVARSLGPPEVSVRPAGHLSEVIHIVVAWELCWYRYEVDLGDSLKDPCVLDQGTELSELSGEDRLANGFAEESGMLGLYES